MLLLLAEGSQGQTYEQLATVLRLPSDLTKIRRVYKYLQSAFVQNNTAIQLNSNQVLFCDINRPVDIDFQEKLEHTYEADYFPVNFIERFDAVNKINNYVREKVKGKIDRIIEPNDLNNANMVLVSAMFFQGQWKVSHFFLCLTIFKSTRFNEMEVKFKTKKNFDFFSVKSN